MDEPRFNVQCPSGHVETRSRLEMLVLFGEEIVDKIDKGIILSAPGISREDCGDCQFEHERQERLGREYDRHLF
jgi:hypothetical protein